MSDDSVPCPTQIIRTRDGRVRGVPSRDGEDAPSARRTSARVWLRIFAGQYAAMQRRMAIGDAFARLALDCADAARSHWAAASQAADIAAQAAREYAGVHEAPDDLDRVTTAILAALDERDEKAGRG